MAEAKIEVLEYVELIGSASQNGNNIYVFYLQKENADHISIVATIYMCSICKKKMQIIFQFLVEKKERQNSTTHELNEIIKVYMQYTLVS